MLAFLGLYPASFLVNLRFGTACECHVQGVYDPRVDDTSPGAPVIHSWVIYTPVMGLTSRA